MVDYSFLWEYVNVAVIDVDTSKKISIRQRGSVLFSLPLQTIGY